MRKLKEGMASQMRMETGALEERLTRKQEKMDQILAILMEGRARIFERREKEEPVRKRRATLIKEPSQEETDEEWARPKRNEREPSIEGENVGGGKPNWLEVPTFCGEDPNPWIRKTEKYFSFYQLNEREKLEAATMSFKGEAEMWFEWEEQNATVRNWHNLKKLILGRFQPWDEGDMCEQWLAIEQIETVAEYRREFVTRLTHLGRKEESLMLGAFMRGLKEEVKTKLKVLRPMNLGQAMSWAKKIEAKIMAQSWLGRRIEPPQKPYPHNTRNYQTNPQTYPVQPHNPSKNYPTRNYPNTHPH